MGAGFPLRVFLIQAAFLFLIIGLSFGKENIKKVEPFFTWDLLWTGYWYNSIKTQEGENLQTEDLFDGGTIYNRANFTLGLPRLKSSFRFLATDKRFLPLVENDPKAGFNPGLGIYHHGSGSRILYGVQASTAFPQG